MHFGIEHPPAAYDPQRWPAGKTHSFQMPQTLLRSNTST